MKKAISISRKVTIIFAILAMACLLFNTYFYIKFRLLVINQQDISVLVDSRMEILMAVSFIIIFLFHIPAFLNVVLLMDFAKKENMFYSLVFFLAVMSFLFVMGDFALMSDISKEYIAGLESGGEWFMLLMSQILHYIFVISIFVLVALTGRKFLDKPVEAEVERDEALFINAQYVGVLCGLLGLFSFLYLSLTSPLWALKKGVFITTLLIMLPYALIVLYWLIIKLREKNIEWYDEKQYQDMAKASIFTLISSIVIMMVIYIIQYFSEKFEFMTITWFPFYVFLVILTFSGSVLYYFRKSIC